MFTLLIIIFIVWVVIVSCKKDKHNVAEDASKLASIPSFSVYAKPMDTFSKMMNLAYDKNQLLKSFSYSNREVVICMESGKTLSCLLANMYVEFQKSQGLICYTIKGNGEKLYFYQTTNVSDKEWDAINSILCLAGETYGRDMFSKAAKDLGYINMALKAIKLLS